MVNKDSINTQQQKRKGFILKDRSSILREEEGKGQHQEEAHLFHVRFTHCFVEHTPLTPELANVS